MTVDIEGIRAALRSRVDMLSVYLLGEQNHSLSTCRELRFGRKGSLSIELASPKHGLWVIGEIDGRSALARRYRDLTADFCGQVGETTPAQLSLIRRVAALSLQCEADEARMVAGEEYDGELYIRRANILGGLIARLGLAKPANTKGDNAKVIDQHTAALDEIDTPSRYPRP